MFELMGDEGAGQVAPIHLPNLEPEAGRDRLQWEKELLGVYAMSHPLHHVSIDLRSVVTCACNELDNRYDGKNVTMVGMIADVRQIMTKKGQRMAFVQIEDMQGQLEVVVFPRTFEEYGELLVQDSIVVVKGKAQTREGQTSLLADLIQDYVDIAKAVETEGDKYQTPLIDVAPTINGVKAVGESNGNGYDVDGVYYNEDDDIPAAEASPFQGEPPAWADTNVIPEDAGDAEAEPAQELEDPQVELLPSEPVSAAANGHTAARPEVAEPDSPAPIPARNPAEAISPDSGRSRTLQIMFRTCGDLERDKYRLKEICEYVRDPRGRDHFRLLLQTGGKTVSLAFPEDPCTINERVMTQLAKHFRVEAEVVTSHETPCWLLQSAWILIIQVLQRAPRLPPVRSPVRRFARPGGLAPPMCL